MSLTICGAGKVSMAPYVRGSAAPEYGDTGGTSLAAGRGRILVGRGLRCRCFHSKWVAWLRLTFRRALRSGGVSSDVSDHVSGDARLEIHLRPWCFAASRGTVIKGLKDLQSSLGTWMLQT